MPLLSFEIESPPPLQEEEEEGDEGAPEALGVAMELENLLQHIKTLCTLESRFWSEIHAPGKVRVRGVREGEHSSALCRLTQTCPCPLLYARSRALL